MNKEELKALRARLNLTQSELALRLGIRRGQVAKLEAGECEIRGAVAVLLGQMATAHPN